MVMGKEMLVMMTWMEMVGNSSLPASLMFLKLSQDVLCVLRDMLVLAGTGVKPRHKISCHQLLIVM